MSVEINQQASELYQNYYLRNQRRQNHPMAPTFFQEYERSLY